MELNKYQDKAMQTCLPTSANHAYMLHGLTEEVGELNGKFSKYQRKGLLAWENNNIVWKGDEDDFYEWLELVIKEMGDCLWMLAGLAHAFGIDLNHIAMKNLDKLAARKEAGTIDGNGDGIRR